MLNHRNLVVLLLFGTTGCPNNSLPEPDYCSDPNSTGITSVEVGRPSLSDTFEPLATGDVLPRIAGSQGADMLELRYRFQGGESTCVGRTIDINIPDGPTIVSQTRSLRAYRQNDNSFLTNSDFLINDLVSGYLEVVVTAGDQSHSARVWLDEVYQGPELLSAEIDSATITVGDTALLTLTLSAPATDLTRALFFSESDAARFSSAGLFLAGQSVVTHEIRGDAVGTATIFAGVGDRYEMVQLEVVEQLP